MIEPDLKYCPNCNDEYMPHIEKCAACAVLLISGRQVVELAAAHEQKLAARAVELTADDEIVAIRRGPLADMKHLESLLQRERISTLIAGDESSCTKGCCPSSFFLQVRSDDVAEAMAVLAEDFRRATALDHHDTAGIDKVYDPTAALASCPACGCTFSTSSTVCPDCGLQLG